MKALRYFGAGDIRCEAMDDPAIADERDAIIKVDTCSICGSDLHIYHGHGYSEDVGFCVGHEAVGEVVEIGRGVRGLKPGDKVMISAAVGCGACPSCLAGDVIHCETQSGSCYGLSSKLQGSQAEAVRVPAADFNARKLPEGFSAEQGLMLTDALPTAWMALKNAEIRPGTVVAVVGLGPIGLMAVEGALLLGASQVFAIDLVASRRQVAESLGATALDAADAPDLIRELTHGRMCGAVIEAVGADATIELALRLAGRRGVVSCLGVNQTRRFAFPMARAFAHGLTFRTGTCSVPEHWPELIPLVQAGRLKPQRFISHRMDLAQGEEAYRLLDSRADGVLKMVLTP
ncbi:MAG: alcohol dehydrogenase [Phenylobacterium zucineum]|nr:MAG: alcohol dehydrogenase [Phenylobacterium zucineum]